MTEDDLAGIEAELGIDLPKGYRDSMLDFPLPACAGNSDCDLWDDAEALTERNQELRRIQASSL